MELHILLCTYVAVLEHWPMTKNTGHCNSKMLSPGSPLLPSAVSNENPTHTTQTTDSVCASCRAKVTPAPNPTKTILRPW